MKKYETITGILSIISILSFGSGTGIILLYNHGDLFSLITVFLTLFSTSFFISGIRNHTNVDSFIQDLIIGITAILFSGIALLLGTYESMASVASLSIYAIVILKVTRNRKQM
jgi:hypothetical protein